MKPLLIIIVFQLCAQVLLVAQNVGVNTNSPDPSAALEVYGNNKGLLIPRVNLLNVTNNTSPIDDPATGLLVYNTNAAVAGGNGVGFYYYNGTRWEMIPGLSALSSADTMDLIIDADRDTRVLTEKNPDEDHIRFDVAGTEAMTIDNNGYVGIGVDTPSARLHIATAPGVAKQLDQYNNAGGSYIGATTPQWQSFTAGITGPLSIVELTFYNTATGTRYIKIYEGEGTGGNLLFTSAIENIAGATPYLMDFTITGVSVTAGQKYTIWVDNANSWLLSPSDSYPGGIAGTGSGTRDFKFKTYSVTQLVDFRVDSGGVSINDYTLPLYSGLPEQVMTYDGAGHLVWTESSDDQTLSISGDTLYIENGNGLPFSAFGDTIWAINNGAIHNQGKDNYATGNSTFAVGEQDTAVGTGLYVAGDNHSVSGDYSSAFGYQQSVNGNFSYAFGDRNVISDNRAFAAGQFHLITANYSTAFGFKDTISGKHSIAVGRFHTILADYALAAGEKHLVSGEASSALGSMDTVSGAGSFAAGINNNVSGNYSGALGIGNYAPADGEFVVGAYNETYTPAGNSTDRIFTVANGDIATGSRSNALTILKSGNVGIGVTNPGALLQIKQSLDDIDGGLRLVSVQQSTQWDLYARDQINVNGSAQNTFTFARDGIKIANLGGNGAWYSASDMRYKNTIQPIGQALDNVLKLVPSTYYYNHQGDNAPLSYGFVAQQVEQIYPDFVMTDQNGMKGIAYQYFGVVAIRAIQEQQQIIDDLRQQLQQQQQINASMNDRLTDLENNISKP